MLKDGQLTANKRMLYIKQIKTIIKSPQAGVTGGRFFCLLI
uniref:Uncharacterized protein n=1 Tax=Anopheles minimus TaxID=112268 RepID=A0A182WQ49_9DIPT